MNENLLIALPFFSADSWLAAKNIEFAIELDGKCDFECLLVSDAATDMTPVAERAATYFKKVHRYIYGRPMARNWPIPQNNAFCQTARHVAAKFKTPWFWWETDAVPTKPGWLATLREEYRKGGKPFGGHWNYEAKIFNGVAIYPASVARYSLKAASADLLELRKQPDGTMYQPPWDFYCSAEVFPKLHIMNGVMQHLWDMDGKPITFPDQASVDKLLRPEVVLFHRTKGGDLIDRLRERRAKPDLATVEKPVVEIDTVHGLSEPGAESAFELPATPKPKVAILIVSYWKDAQWLEYCLRSIAKYAIGFAGVTVAYPYRDKEAMRPICFKHGAAMQEFKEIEGKGHLHQNAAKCMADKLCPKAEFVLHVDSDCLFYKPVSPRDYFVDGKPVLLIEEYERLKPVNSGHVSPYLWKAGTEKALGMKCQYEAMRRHPAVHPRALYSEMRDHIENLHGVPFLDYVMAQSEVFPYGFSEFNCLGAYAHHFLYDEYHWTDVAMEPYPESKLVQFWTGGTNQTYDKSRALDEPPPWFIWVPDEFKGMKQLEIVKAILA